MDRDQQFAQFAAAYPAARRQKGYMAETLFLHALTQVSFETLMAAVQQHRRSEQWQNPRMIPNLMTWLEQQRWEQILPEPPAVNLKRMTPYERAKYEGLK